MNRFIKSQDGSQILEFVVLIPFFIIIVLIIWQFALAGYTMVVAAAAAQNGARAAAAGNDGVAAASKTAYGFKTKVTEEKKPAEVTIKVTLEVPLIKIAFLEGRRVPVSSTATMPLESNL